MRTASPKRVVLKNCRAYTPYGVCSSVVIIGERIAFLGDEEEALEIAGRDSIVIDLKNSAVLPGFIDAHLHLLEYALSEHYLDLKGVRSIRELKTRLHHVAAQLKEGEWIIGRGWDQELFLEGRWPSRHDIDPVTPRNPVILYRICGHVALVNSEALRIAGINEKSPDPPGGIIERDTTGAPTGILKEKAIDLVRKVVPRPSFEDKIFHLKKALRELASLGITCICSMSCDLSLLDALKILESRNELPLRVRLFFPVKLMNLACKMRRKLSEGGRIKVLGVKIFVDGTLGARTAFLREPYSDYPTRGSLCISRKELETILRRANNMGLQVATHAIGDEAIEVTLDSYEKELNPLMRPRIEHASVMAPDLISHMARLGVIAVVQPHFIISDWWIVNRLGPLRARWAYAFRSMLRAGIPLALSTDAPVEPSNPWLTVYAAVTRGKWERIKFTKYSKGEELPLRSAVSCYTKGSAYALFDELSMGELEIGKWADLIVVQEDPFKAKEKDLKNIKVILTMVGGKIVFYNSRKIKLPPEVTPLLL